MVRVMPCELAKTDIHQQNYTLQTLLALLLTVETCKSFAEREKVILAQIQEPDMRENLCLLNEILLVKVLYACLTQVTVCVFNPSYSMCV